MFLRLAPCQSFRDSGVPALKRFYQACTVNWMTEGRRCQVVLLDEHRLEILIQPKLYAGELLDMVASHFNLKEKEYFGLNYFDDRGNCHWLQLDHRVLDHDIPKKNVGVPMVFHFAVKFFVEGISQLRDAVTVEQFFLQAKSLLFKGHIEVESEVSFELAAHALQVAFGDYIDNAFTKTNLKKVPLLPASVLREQPSISACEEKVIEHYKKLSGQSRGFAIVNYMSIIEGLPTYGVHFFEVKDKGGTAWWLGLSYKGIAQYDQSNKKIPKKVFQWRLLENLYFRDRKFSIEVHDPKRVSVSRRTFGPGNVVVLVWFAANPILAKSIWSMAISQHQFYLDRKQSKGSNGSLRRLSEIATELSTSRHSLSTGSTASNPSRSGSSQSLNSHLPNGGMGSEDPAQSEAAAAARQEMLAALKARKDALEEKLKEKTDQLRTLCIQEAEICGELPIEMPLTPGEPRPLIRRRMGTSFILPENLINRLDCKEEEDLATLEMDFEINSKISSAALILANDPSVKKSVRKQRKVTYMQYQEKLKGIEQKLLSARHALTLKNPLRGQVKKKQPRPAELDCSRNISLDDVDSVFGGQAVDLSMLVPCVTSPGTPQCDRSIDLSHSTESQIASHSPVVPRGAEGLRSSTSSLTQGLPPTPGSPYRQPHFPISRTASPSRFSGGSGGYIPNSLYQTRSSYRSDHFPTFSTRTQRCQSEYDNISNGSSNSSGPLYKNKYDASVPIESRGLYNVPMQRTSQAFRSQDELDEARLHGPGGDVGPVGPSSRRHHTVSHPYGSLDRTFASAPHHHNHHLPQNSVRMDSRSMDQLLYAECNGRPSSATEEERGPAEERLSISSRGSGDYPVVSPPSPYDVPYGTNDFVDQICSRISPLPSPNAGATASAPRYPSSPFCIPEHPMLNGDCGPAATDRYLTPRFGSGSSNHPHHHHNAHQKRTVSRPEEHGWRGSTPRNIGYPRAGCPSPRSVGSYDEPPPRNPPTPSVSVMAPSSAPSPCPTTVSTGPVGRGIDIKIVKEKEWFETCLDSPLPPRRCSTSGSISPRTTSSLSSPSSPLKPPGCRSSTVPGGEPEVMTATTPGGGGLRFTPSPTCHPDKTSPLFLPIPFESPQNCTVVTVGQFQPYREETKPYELADYYKYSTKVKQQKEVAAAAAGNGIARLTPAPVVHDGPDTPRCAAAASHSKANHRPPPQPIAACPSPRPSRLGLLPSDECDGRTSQPIYQNHPPASPGQLGGHGAHSDLESPGFSSRGHPWPPTNPRNQRPPTSPDCILPDEAYNMHPAFLSRPQQLQGIYHPPKPLACNLLKPSQQCTPLSSPNSVRSNSLIKSNDNSFVLDDATSLADAFHEEMLAWYEDQETANQATLV